MLDRSEMNSLENKTVHPVATGKKMRAGKKLKLDSE
jgi:hypothetical protein